MLETVIRDMRVERPALTPLAPRTVLGLSTLIRRQGI